MHRLRPFAGSRSNRGSRPKAVARRPGLAVMSRITSFDMYDLHAYSEDDGNGRERWTAPKKRSSGVAARPKICGGRSRYGAGVLRLSTTTTDDAKPQQCRGE